VGILVSFASVWLLAELVDLNEVGRALRRADWSFVSLAVALLFASLAAKTLRWQLLLPRTADVRFLGLFRILQISMFLNNVLPLRMGDVVRGSMAARRPGLGLAHVVASMLAERLVDAVILIACFSLVAPFISQRALGGEPGGSVVLPGVLMVSLLVGLGGTALFLRVDRRPFRVARRSRHSSTAGSAFPRQAAGPSG
jgi:uncharacterized protein (TIRG00374 family)